MNNRNKLCKLFCRAAIFLIIPYLFLLFSAKVSAQTGSYIPGQSYWGNNNYVEYIPGELPIIIDIPHSGKLKPSEIHDRTQGTVLSGTDTNSREYARAAADEIKRITGKRPHLIIAHLYRSKVDFNRDLKEAAWPHVSSTSNPNLAQQAWLDYHKFIDDAKTIVRNSYGEGHVFDCHTSSYNYNHIGTKLNLSDLKRSDSALNTSTYINKSSLRHLATSHGNNLAGVTRGKYSLGSYLTDAGILSAPSTKYPDSLPNSGTALLTGAYNVRRHGSSNGGTIDATQIETGYSLIRTQDAVSSYSKILAQSMLKFVKQNYGFTDDFRPSNQSTPQPTATVTPRLTPSATPHYTPTPTLRPSPTSTPGSSSCNLKSLGDANCDGVVNGVDYSLWINNQCKRSSTQSCVNTQADFNGDGHIDDGDYAIWFVNRG